MVEKEKIREKEAESTDGLEYEKKVNYYKEVIARGRTGRKVIHGKDLPWSFSRQGISRHYLDFYKTENALTTMRFFVHDVRTHSGKHVHQGDIVLFILRGKGSTVVDGKTFDWSEGDLILLPVKRGGVEHQHFNKDGKSSRWLAMRSLPLTELIGNFIEQKETSPWWKGK